MPTPSMEDYIEQIYLLISSKGYARVSDLAEVLSVHPSSVTKMIQKLDKTQYVEYEKYRGFILTQKGEKFGKRMVERHEILEQFMRIIGITEDKVYDDVEKMEHHLSWEAIDRIADLVQYFKLDENRIKELYATSQNNEGTQFNDPKKDSNKF